MYTAQMTATAAVSRMWARLGMGTEPGHPRIKGPSTCLPKGAFLKPVGGRDWNSVPERLGLLTRFPRTKRRHFSFREDVRPLGTIKMCQWAPRRRVLGHGMELHTIGECAVCCLLQACSSKTDFQAQTS